MSVMKWVGRLTITQKSQGQQFWAPILSIRESIIQPLYLLKLKTYSKYVIKLNKTNML